MTLDEAIKHARDKANEENYYARFERGKHIQSCKKCAEEHEQLAEWLEELKKYYLMRKKIMGYKFFLYVFVTIVVIWAMDSVNINQIFKKNKIMQARVFYFLIGISLIYLVTNFLSDLFTSIKIV